MAKPLFSATIMKKGESYWASYHTHRTSDRAVLDRGPFATLGAAQLWLESEARVKGIPLTWTANTYRAGGSGQQT
jgi:hypothetical protein